MSAGKDSKVRLVAVVSGGPDSFCTLIKWLSRGYSASLLFFDYGQKASRREYEVVANLAGKINELAVSKGWGSIIEVKKLDLGGLREIWPGRQLTDETVGISDKWEETVVVPVRNVVMATIAAAYAYALADLENLDRVVILLGSHLDDVKPREDTYEPLYPDCSPECIKTLETALGVCHFRAKRVVEIWTPSIGLLRKSELLRECYELIGDLVYETYSCYAGGEKHCGVCESCRNRKKAFREAGLPDKTVYEVSDS